jgi:6-phosphogluconolactonase
VSTAAAAPELRTFEDPDALAKALARYVADRLAARIRRDGKAALAVSGGRTPVRFFEALSAEKLPWSDVVVTLVDDRWVGETSERSNARLVRQHLLRGPAAGATFVPLWRPTETPEEALPGISRAVADLPLPFAAVVLGMGDDGHTASFFPGGDTLSAALDPSGRAPVVAMRAPGAGEPRITLTLPPILAAETVALHVEGAGQKSVLDAALAGDDVLAMPVRAVLAAKRPPTIFWSP